MRDMHPIDDQFRQALTNAEVEPPPQVLAGVLAALPAERRRGFFFFWSAIGLIAAGAAFWYFVPTGQSTPRVAENKTRTTEDRSAAEQVGIGDLPMPSTAELPITEVLERHANASAPAQRALPTTTQDEVYPNEQMRSPRKGATDKLVVDPSNTGSAKGALTLDGRSAAAAVQAPASRSVETAQAQETLLMAADTEHNAAFAALPVLTTRPVISLDLLAIRIAERAEHDPLLRTASGSANDYVIPNGEWTLGPVVGAYRSKVQWRGTDEELANAIQATSDVRNSVAWGFSAGRTWRSGWGFSTGVMVEQGRKQERLLDRSTLIEREVRTRLVTLGAMVFSSVTDTLITSTTTETEYQGEQRSTLVRMPLVAHWTGARGRLLYGASAGVAVEYTRRSGGPVLVRNAADARIVPVLDDAGIGQDRTPLTLLASAGLEVGYLLHERWSIRGGPVAFKGLSALGPTSNVFALPDRLGIEVRLVHHLYRLHRP